MVGQWALHLHLSPLRAPIKVSIKLLEIPVQVYSLGLDFSFLELLHPPRSGLPLLDVFHPVHQAPAITIGKYTVLV